MIKVYQLQLTNEEMAIVNSDGWYTPRIHAYFAKGSETRFRAAHFQYYNHVANVHTDDMEDAFREMNLWEDESMIERLGRCSSMSVGDILELEDGSLHRVASFGFTALENAHYA